MQKLKIIPLTMELAQKDFAAVVDHREFIFNKPTPPECGEWPTLDFSYEQNIKDIEYHRENHELGNFFTYSVLEDDKYVGCIYIYPTNENAKIYYWGINESYDDKVKMNLLRFVKENFTFRSIIFPGR